MKIMERESDDIDPYEFDWLWTSYIGYVEIWILVALHVSKSILVNCEN